MTISKEQILKVLQDRFGYSNFRPGQLATIQSIVDGHNTLAVLPTGGGKSLLYQLPAYLLPGAVLIVSPLISLMQDQVARLRKNGEKRVLMLSGQDSGQLRRQQLTRLGQVKFIFSSPELLANDEVATALAANRPSILTIDEAHCISQWGPDFRPEYLQLKQLRRRLGDPPTLLLTATATKRVCADILHKLGLTAEQVTIVRRSVNRPNIFLATEELPSPNEKEARLLELVTRLPGAGIIYFASRRLATSMANWLRAHSQLSISAYHAGMPTADRFRVQQQFMAGQLQVICATSAFGMGIDKSDIRFIIHYHLPTSLENYIQEIGRAGRDSRQSVAVLLYAPGDEQLTHQLTSIELPSEQRFDQVAEGKLPSAALGPDHELFNYYQRHHYSYNQLSAIFNRRRRQADWQLRQVLTYLSLTTCRRQFIMRYFDETPVNQAVCCDLEDPDWLDKPLLPTREPPKRASITTDNWEGQLRRLLNLTKESNI